MSRTLTYGCCGAPVDAQHKLNCAHWVVIRGHKGPNFLEAGMLILNDDGSVTEIPPDAMVDQLVDASKKIYEATRLGPANWVQHTHGPTDTPATCPTCQMLGVTQEDLDNAEQVSM